MNRLLIVLIASSLAVSACGSESESSGSAPAAGAPARTYTREQREAAEFVMGNSQEFATFEDSGSTLRVTFKPMISNAGAETQHELITAIANSDAVLNGRARTIYFYRTDGKKIGQADNVRGIRLLDE